VLQVSFSSTALITWFSISGGKKTTVLPSSSQTNPSCRTP